MLKGFMKSEVTSENVIVHRQCKCLENMPTPMPWFFLYHFLINLCGKSANWSAESCYRSRSVPYKEQQEHIEASFIYVPPFFHPILIWEKTLFYT